MPAKLSRPSSLSVIASFFSNGTKFVGVIFVLILVMLAKIIFLKHDTITGSKSSKSVVFLVIFGLTLFHFT
jgi:hypothetical protein